MYYKLYIDSIFILQMTSNLYMLSLTGQILKCTATHRRIWLGALIGAAMFSAVIMLPIGTVGIRILIGAVPVSMCMLTVSFRIRHGKKLIHGSLVMAGCGFFLGSIMIWILNRLRMALRGNASLFITLLTGYVSYRIMLKILITARKRKENCLRTVSIYVPKLDQRLHVQALLDTGNHLTDPVSKAPVCLISAKLAKQIDSIFMPEKYHVIPFQSVGKDRGVLNAYELPELVIDDHGQNVKKEHVIVAICNTGIPEESIYQMILHPRLLED
ncbi:MAG: sigma-E processing peptidase SpoIIGA [Lachnospiraceae bacterium]|nr:sigma-E processing peptidase SpoIIGA [Lachnospiraceae bacterium]